MAKNKKGCLVFRHLLEKTAHIMGPSSASAQALADADSHKGPVLFWQKGETLVVEKLTLGTDECRDCGVKPGEQHKEGCDVERCRSCGGQYIGCGCEGQLEGEVWTGFWPGEVECKALGWMVSEEIPDLNRLAVYRVTGKDSGPGGGCGFGQAGKK